MRGKVEKSRRKGGKRKGGSHETDQEGGEKL